MNTFNAIDINNNKYGKYIIEQSNLRAHFEHIDDSLFSLSLRQPKISEKVNAQITDVYFNIDKALSQLTENRLYQGASSQQYAITASNELASFLSDVLDNMEQSMSPSPGSGDGGGEQLPDIIMSQEELNKKMEEGVKKGDKGKAGEEGKKGEESKDGEGEKPGSKGKKGEAGEGEKPGDKGQSGKAGENGESGENGKSGKQQGKGGEGGQSGQKGNQKGEGGQSGKDGNNGNNGKYGKNGSNGKNNGDGNDGEGDKKDGYGEGGSEEQNGELYKIYQQQQQLRQALEDRLTKDGTIQSAGQLIKQMEEIELDLLNSGFTNQTLQKMMDVQHQLLKLENATFMQGEDTKRKSETNKKQYNQTNQSQIPTAKQYFNITEILNRQVLPLQNRFKKKIKEYFKSTND